MMRLANANQVSAWVLYSCQSKGRPCPFEPMRGGRCWRASFLYVRTVVGAATQQQQQQHLRVHSMNHLVLPARRICS